MRGSGEPGQEEEGSYVELPLLEASGGSDIELPLLGVSDRMILW
jgi:hypothetical protein